MARTSLLISLLITLGHALLRSQDYIRYYNLRNEAVHTYMHNELNRSEELLSEAMREADPPGKDAYLLAIISACLGKKENAQVYLKLAIAKQGVPSAWLIEDSPVFRAVLDSTTYDSLLAFVNVQSTFIEFERRNNPFDLALERWADTLIQEDQRYRSLSNPEAYDPVILDSLRRHADRKTQHKLMTYVLRHGWPKRSSELLTTILLHFTPENYITYKDYILEEVKAGRLDPYWYASMVDRMEGLIHNNPCVYGIWGNCEANTETIVKNRLEIGLSPYWNGPYRTYKRLQ